VSSGPVCLVLLRHGQSEWNAAGIFTGWENAHLTAHGELEAARAGALLAGHGVLPAFVHTSLQRRTIRTADLASRPPTVTGYRSAGPGDSTAGTTGHCRAGTKPR
jgi:bisphosphoglycerate-dependent phosphoglycerate mutase